METFTSNGIFISVTSFYQKLHSRPAMNQYVHIYEVTIRNDRPEPVQLLSRHWRIWDSNNRTKEVKGKGVIGKQPVIQPGKSYSYRSWSPITSSMGKMWGHFNLITLPDEQPFRATIPTFPLIDPSILN